MRNKGLLAASILAATLLGASGAAAAATTIEVWHALSGVDAEAFTNLVERFNTEQSAVHVDAVYKGDPKATVDAAAAAAHTPAAPTLVQVQDEVTDRLLSIKGAVRPIYEVLPLTKSPDFDFFIPSSVTFMKDAHGKLYGFPFRASIPVLLYNRDAYKKAGLDPDAPPGSWHDLQKQLLALQASDPYGTCFYTTSEQSWIHVENLSTVHGETFATKNNGLDGAGASLTFNDLLHVRHIALLESWVKARLFEYVGHEREGDASFASGHCLTLTTGSDGLGEILAHAKFSVGVAPLPYYDEAPVHTSHSLVNGSAFWAMTGKKPDEYRAAAAFLAYLATPVVAAEWTQRTGALPLTRAALLASEKSTAYGRAVGFTTTIQGVEVAPGNAARGERLPHFDKVRDVIDAELESVWSGAKAPKQALDDAVSEGDAAMREPAPAPAAKPSTPHKAAKKTT